MLLLSIASFAQANGSIKGTLKDEDGKSIEFANILIKGTEKGTSSDSKGDFNIANVAAGEYTLKISAIGYEMLTYPVTVKSGEIAELVIVLKTSAL
jgi:iron complex outermembrane receptor protein